VAPLLARPAAITKQETLTRQFAICLFAGSICRSPTLAPSSKRKLMDAESRTW
jgi:hypothetical protein